MTSKRSSSAISEDNHSSIKNESNPQKKRQKLQKDFEFGPSYMMDLMKRRKDSEAKSKLAVLKTATAYISPKKLLSKNEIEASIDATGSERQIDDGTVKISQKKLSEKDIVTGEWALAEAIARNLRKKGFKPEIKYLSSDKKSWTLYCPKWYKVPHESFKELWNLHPDKFNEIMMFGKLVKIPRWQQAYGQSYKFSGQLSVAEKNIPKVVNDCMDRVGELIPWFGFKMALVNWYAADHYLGPHHDDIKQMVPGSPIVSISWGMTRTFRIKRNNKRPCTGGKNISLQLRSGDLLLMSWGLNKSHKHEVIKLSKTAQSVAGGRINLTFRSFREPSPGSSHSSTPRRRTSQRK